MAGNQQVAQRKPGGMASILKTLAHEIVTEFKDLFEGQDDYRGIIASHIRDVLGLTPEIIRAHLIPFEFVVGAATFTVPTPTRISADYDFELTGMTCSFQQPATNPENMATLLFNMREAGRNFDVFENGAINLQNLASTAGPGAIIEWPRGLYKFRAGAEIQPSLARNTNAGAWAGADKIIDVLLIGNLIRKGK